MTSQTPEERLALVESILGDTYKAYRLLQADRDPSDFDAGKMWAYRMVLDTFAELGFDIGGEDQE